MKHAKARRLPALVIALVLLCACDDAGARGLGTDVGSSPADSAPEIVSAPVDSPPGTARPPMKIVLDGFVDARDNADGFYLMELPQGDRYYNLLYNDYNTLEQRYVCDVPGCAHDTEACASWFRACGGAYAFSQGDYLFINFAAWDDGTGWENRENWPSAIVRFNLDASDPQLMVTYPPYQLQLSQAYGDGEALYFHAPDGFVRLDVESFEKTVLLPEGWNRQEETGQNTGIINVLEDDFLCLRYTRNPDGLAVGDYQWLRLDVFTGEETLLHTAPEDAGLPLAYDAEGQGYYIDDPTGQVRCINILTGEDTLVTDALCAQNELRTRVWYDMDERMTENYYYFSSWGANRYGDWLVMQGYDEEAFQPKMQSYNLVTAELVEAHFTTYFNGSESSMIVWAETPRGLLVIEEFHPRTFYTTGTGGDPISVQSDYRVFALIDPEDFARGVPNFRTLQPVAYSGAW